MLDPVLLSSIGDLELVARVVIDGAVSGLHRSPFHGASMGFRGTGQQVALVRAGAPPQALTTGGVVADSSSLAPLESHLRSLGRRDVPADRHPTRSVGWGVAFAAALCGEWAPRRRGGAR